MTKINTYVPTESEEQQTLFRYCSVETMNYPELSMLTHIPNEGKRTISAGARLKREGLKKGYPDIILDVPNNNFHGLRIELKRRKGSKKTNEQKEWIKKLCDMGYAASFCYGWEEAWNFIHAYLTCNKSVTDEYISRSLREAAK